MSIFDCRLPQDWKREPLSANYRITKKQRGFSLEPEMPLPFIPMELVPAGGQTSCGFELRKPAAIASGTYFEAGDVLLSKITPSFENGKQGLARDLPGKFGYGSTEIIPIQSRTSGADNLYLFYLLLHHEVRDSLTSKMEGSTGRQRVPEGAVRDLEIPVPPLPEQQKIAAVLWMLQRAIATQDRLLKATRDLKQSAMQRLFTHGLRGEPLKETEIGPTPESWSLRPIGKLGQIVTGSTPKTARHEYYTDGQHHFIAPGDMGSATEIRCTVKKITEVGMQVSRVLPQGATCVVCIGSSIGKVGITTQQRSTTNQQVNSVVPSSDFDPDYVCYLLQYHSGLIASRAAPSPVPILSKSQFSSIELPVTTDAGEQRDIATTLATIDRKLAHHQRKRAALDDLFQTTLHQLMTAQIRVADLDIDISEVVQ